jgi:endonuclease YncB( thermonuclease family)
VLALSLNHRRRIFRPSARPLSFSDLRVRLLGSLLAVAGGLVAIVVVPAPFVRSSDTVPGVSGSSHLSAGADRLSVLDGDTLRVGGQVVRLEGISAPARGSVCHFGGRAGGDPQDMDCGSAAANALASLVRGSAVDCAIRSHDEQGRPVANCLAGGTRLNEALVLDGWAKAETASLRVSEATARAAGRGIWRSDCRF